MISINPRENWQDPREPVYSSARYSKSGITDVNYHYPGGGSLASFQNPIAKLRQMQHSYLVDPNRGYSLGYNYCIDLSGVVWEVRGLDFRSAAVAGFNDKAVTVQFFVPGTTGEPINMQQLLSAVELHKQLEEEHGRRLLVTSGHRDRGTTRTPCPGQGIYAQLPTIDRLVHEPPPPPPPMPPFNPSNRQYGLWPIAANKRHLTGGMRGDDVWYLQGVMHFEIWRFVKWFLAKGYGNVGQQNWLNYLDQMIFPLDGNSQYNDVMIHAVYCMQQAFAWSAFEDQHIGPLEMDGTVGPLTWAFIDMNADQRWGNT